MNSLSKLAGFVTAAVMLAAFSMPASAAKQITLVMDSSALPTVLYATISNPSTGNSTANSFAVGWTLGSADLVTRAEIVVGNTVVGAPASCGPAPGLAGLCTFNNQSPLKIGTSVRIKLTLKTPTDQCAGFSASWTSYAWTGAPGPLSTSFTQTNGPQLTSWTPTCTLQFVPQPADAFVEKQITGSALDDTGTDVTVKAVANGLAPSSSIAVSVNASPSGCATASNPQNTTGGIADFSSLTAGAVPVLECVLTATALGYSSATKTIRIVKFTGDLDCGQTKNPVTNDAGASATITRLDNPDEVTCSKVPYALIWRGDKSLEFLKPDVTQHVATRLTITWPNETPAPAASLTTTDPTYGRLGKIKLSQQQFPGSGLLPIDLCQGDPTYGLDPDPLHTGEFLIVLKSLAVPAGIDLVSGGTVQYGCVYERNISYPDDNTIGVTELIYLEGDWGASRN